MGRAIYGIRPGNTTVETESVKRVLGSDCSMSSGMFPQLHGPCWITYPFHYAGIYGGSDATACSREHANLRRTKRKVHHDNYSGRYNCRAGHYIGDYLGRFFSAVSGNCAGVHAARCDFYLLRDEHKTLLYPLIHDTHSFCLPVTLFQKTKSHSAINYAVVRTAIFGRHLMAQSVGLAYKSSAHCKCARFKLAFLYGSFALHLYATVPRLVPTPLLSHELAD